MKYYVGCKLIQAKPMTRGDYNIFRGWTIPADENPNDEGYMVKYSDEYIAWSPKDAFEQSYMEVQENLKLESKVSIGQKMVDDFIKEIHVSTLGDKTTLVRCVLINNFEIIESSACVDPKNYSEEMGAEVCMKKIKDRIWSYLGFLLQTAYKGIK